VLFFGGSSGQKVGKKKMVRAKSGQKKDGAGKKRAKKGLISTAHY
jgi:hypothetical protein